ncbi:DUF3794 domain-containing protein [Desulfolucanica intricata]|uniref:DUF3794 domain-containing protein n=1 Tax=Desulfolucanica intricata TaxID=1285191 RepID=UPI000836AD6B|nr:DUF3794 domain-containing protein [Desulfolucanica intricata]
MTCSNHERFVSSGTAKVLCEMDCEIHPSMSRIIDERFDVNITDCTVFADKAMFRGIVEVSLIYKHPHLKKKREDTNRDLTQKEDCSSPEDKKDNEDKKTKKKDRYNWYNRVRNIHGIIHYYEETIEFTGIIEVPGAKPGDNYHVEKVEVKEYEAFKPTKKDHNNLITAGKQIFIINVELKITRNVDIYTQQLIFVQKRR